MSFDPSDPQHEVEIEDLLLQILRELKLQTMILNEMTGFNLTSGDLDE